MDNQIINIVYCGNRKIFKGVLISILSVLKHNKTPINFYILSANFEELNKDYLSINEKQINFLDGLVKKTNRENKIIFIDVTNLYKRIFEGKNNFDPHHTPYTNLRLLLDHLDNMPDKMLYLDTDVVCNNSLHGIWSTDISEYEIACVRDAYRISKTYFNAGVLLLNMVLIKKNNILQKVRDCLFLKKHYFFADQAALNKVIEKKLMLDIKYNSKSKYDKSIVLHHFCDVRHFFFHRIKPWEVNLVKKKMDAYDDILDTYVSTKEQSPELFN